MLHVQQNGNSLERFHFKFHLLSNIHEINLFSLFSSIKDHQHLTIFIPDRKISPVTKMEISTLIHILITVTIVTSTQTKRSREIGK